MGFDVVRAQPNAVRMLRKAAQAGHVAQAYLFEGPSGTGKKLAARALACAALCTQRPGEGCGACADCRRISDGVHPDVRVFAPRDEGNRNIQIEFLREEVLPFTKFAPFEARAAFVIFPEADVSFPENHPESANALLKTLEEPRARVHFVLTSEQPSRLLPTIRSRCQRVRFGRLPDLALEAVMENESIPIPRRAAAIALADGRADQALLFARDDSTDSLLSQALRIDEALASPKAGLLVSVAESIASHDSLLPILETVALYYRDVVAAGLGLGRAGIRFASEVEKIEARAKSLSPSRAALRAENFLQLREKIERNANPEMLLNALFFELATR